MPGMREDGVALHETIVRKEHCQDCGLAETSVAKKMAHEQVKTLLSVYPALLLVLLFPFYFQGQVKVSWYASSPWLCLGARTCFVASFVLLSSVRSAADARAGDRWS